MNVDPNMTLIDNAIETVLSTRDFCGDEKAVLRDWEDENGKLTSDGRRHVWREVDRRWREYQLEAGVKKPVDCFERKSIYNIMEKAP